MSKIAILVSASVGEENLLYKLAFAKLQNRHKFENSGSCAPFHAFANKKSYQCEYPPTYTGIEEDN